MYLKFNGLKIFEFSIFFNFLPFYHKTDDNVWLSLLNTVSLYEFTREKWISQYQSEAEDKRLQTQGAWVRPRAVATGLVSSSIQENPTFVFFPSREVAYGCIRTFSMVRFWSQTCESKKTYCSARTSKAGIGQSTKRAKVV